LGHDAAQLKLTNAGWLLRGCAVFRHGADATCLGYVVELDKSWATRRAETHGFIGCREIAHTIVRSNDGWLHNGAHVRGLDHLLDVDFGFTPATNLQQLRRASLRVGDEVQLPVIWLDADATRLVELPQRYRRLDATRYEYEAPTVLYRATLEIADNGFVALYPNLWTMEM
jgi:hypothetical protein